MAVVARELRKAGLLHEDARTVDGRTLGEIADSAEETEGQTVVVPIETPLKARGGVAVLYGNLAPEGCAVKLASHDRTVHRGPARVFDSEEDCFAAVEAGRIGAGDVVAAGEVLGTVVTTATQLAGGASKEAWAVTTADGRELLLRRAGGGVIHVDTLSLRDEFAVISAARDAGVRVPEPIAYLGHLDGREAFVMDAVGRGSGPHCPQATGPRHPRFRRSCAPGDRPCAI